MLKKTPFVYPQFDQPPLLCYSKFIEKFEYWR